jgi:hypothetical protein
VEGVVTMHDSMARTRSRRPGFPASGTTANSNVLMSGTAHSCVGGWLLEPSATGTQAHAITIEDGLEDDPANEHG